MKNEQLSVRDKCMTSVPLSCEEAQALEEALTDTETQLAEAIAKLDDVYKERNQLVALAAKLAMKQGHSVSLCTTNIPGWDEEWHNCVYIQLPSGQVSWHFNNEEYYLFQSIPYKEVVWDGHSTLEKYDRVNNPML